MIEELALTRPRVDPKLILRLQKYRDLERVSPVVREAAQRMASLAETLVDPRGWMRREPVSTIEPTGRVRLAAGVEFSSRALARLLRDATEAALVILTIGPALEGRVQRLIADDRFAEALLLDTAGWVALERLAGQFRARLRAWAGPRGLRPTGRTAPGFADWPLEQQWSLFSLFADSTLSVRLTESCVMIPQKSVSGIYGLIPAARA